jgi:hypothetical protein
VEGTEFLSAHLSSSTVGESAPLRGVALSVLKCDGALGNSSVAVPDTRPGECPRYRWVRVPHSWRLTLLAEFGRARVVAYLLRVGAKAVGLLRAPRHRLATLLLAVI